MSVSDDGERNRWKHIDRSERRTAPNNVSQSRKFTHPVCSRCNPLLLYGRARYIPDDFVLFSRDGSAHSTEFQDIDSVTRASLRAPLSRVRKRSTKLIAALPLAFETRKSANSSAATGLLYKTLLRYTILSLPSVNVLVGVKTECPSFSLILVSKNAKRVIFEKCARVFIVETVKCDIEFFFPRAQLSRISRVHNRV